MNDKLYWNKRYASGGNSGSGSRGQLAMYKADVINDLIVKHKIHTLLDLGCGDGYQGDMYKVQRYLGYDISDAAIDLCKARYFDRVNASFDVYHPNMPLPIAEMAISMDVLFHITDKSRLETYLKDLFGCAEKVVVVYAYDHDNSDNDRFAPHYKPVKFTSIIKEQHPDWMLSQHIENKFPVKEFGTAKGSYSDFYIYIPRLE